MKIELITHCYALKYAHYAALLNYQLSSLVLHPPECDVSIVVCLEMSDKRTQKVIQFFCANSDLQIKTVSLTDREIGRRSIGRNIAAKSTHADIVWFTDVDHFFWGCLDLLCSMGWDDATSMIYPKEIQIHKNHTTGDLLTNKAAGVVKLRDINKDDFKTKKYWKAIGGVQIVLGELARSYGYLGGHKKWQEPVDKPFSDFRDDGAYRLSCLPFGKIRPVHLPGVFRLRHTQTTYK